MHKENLALKAFWIFYLTSESAYAQLLRNDKVHPSLPWVIVNKVRDERWNSGSGIWRILAQAVAHCIN